MAALNERNFWASGTSLLALLLSISSCRCEEAAPGEPEAGRGAEPQVSGPSESFEAATFHSAPSLEVRGSLSGLTGRYPTTPALVSSPCGYYLVASLGERTVQALFLGRERGWTAEEAGQLFRLDDVVFDAGLVSAGEMGNAAARGQELLELHGQWEVAWLRKEINEQDIAVKENARGTAHAPPHPAWRVWSSTLPVALPLGLRPTRHLLVAASAVGDSVLVVRVLLPDEGRALWALRRLVFLVDSLEVQDQPIPRTEFLEGVRTRAERDPGCEELHLSYGKELEEPAR